MPLVVEDLLARVQEACRHLSVPPGDSYLSSYPLLLAHVAALTHSAPVDERALVAVAHLVYGWMPTVLHLDFMLLPGAVQQVEKARQGIILEAEELQQVAAAVNHSVVGVSKVLHFVNPALYPIWDRRVYRFCHRPSGAVHEYQVNNAAAYADYAATCRQAVRLAAFEPIRRAVRQQLLPHYATYANHPMEPLRALEFVMFSAGSNGSSLGK